MESQELKDKIIFVKFVVQDTLPSSGLKRMQYYTSLADVPGKYFFGLSLQRSWSRNELVEMVAKGQLVDLGEPVRLPFEKDLWLDKDGQVIMATAYEPWSDSERRVISRPRQLSKSYTLVDSQLKEDELPNISKYNTIS